MNDDGDLLRQFAATRDEDCFRQLVERRIGFVYAVNLRRLGDVHLAQDATQAVFVALARKAAIVGQSSSVMGWLHRSSCYESRNMRRSQANRIARESEAQRLGTTGAGEAGTPVGNELEPVLDEILSQLPDADREVILARFFSEQSYAHIGVSIGTSENAARMRVDRALAKLRESLHRRGFQSTAAILAASLPAYATAAVPAVWAGTVAKAAVAGLSTTALPAAILALMNTTKITAAVGVLAASFIGYEVYQTHQLKNELVAMREEQATATAQVRDLEAQIVVLKTRPAEVTKFVSSSASATKTAAVEEIDSPEIPGITRKAPAGWHQNGTNTAAYHVGVDEHQTWGGMPSAYAESKPSAGDAGFGGMMQSTSAEAFKNQRVKLTGWVKTEDAKGGGHLWLRVDGQNPRDMLAFDNMDNRAPKGTTDWQEYSVVLDVADQASKINYGFFVQGTGKMWVNGLTIQPVPADVPTTNMVTAPQQLPKTPVNLGFSPK